MHDKNKKMELVELLRNSVTDISGYPEFKEIDTNDLAERFALMKPVGADERDGFSEDVLNAISDDSPDHDQAIEERVQRCADAVLNWTPTEFPKPFMRDPEWRARAYAHLEQDLDCQCGDIAQVVIGDGKSMEGLCRECFGKRA